MIFVGIDVASQKHDFYAFQDKSQKCIKRSSITIPNSLDGFDLLYTKLMDFCNDMNDHEVKIGLESTGIYNFNILSYLVDKGLSVYLINPVLTSKFAKAQSVHQAKTDNVDCRLIARFLQTNWGSLSPFSKVDKKLIDLKVLTRERFKLCEQRKMVKIYIHNILVRMFPAFLDLFSNPCGETALKILVQYPDTKLLARAHVQTLNELMNGHCRTNAQTLIDAAKTNIGQQSQIMSSLLLTKIKQYRTLSKTIEEYDSNIESYVNELQPSILSIPGIGKLSCATIISEIGDINRFSSVDQLISYSGLDVRVYESGKYVATHSFPSKRGSHYLRYALYNAARILVLHDEVFKAYMAKKKAEGKHFLVALGHVQKKLLRTIYSLMKTNKTYEPVK